MNNKWKIWLTSLRLRTVPLSLAGILTGSAIALAEGKFNPRIFIWALVTAALYQILSNLANDYGDGIKGTDRNRKGPVRGVGSGIISPAEMKKAVVITSLLSVISTYILLKTAFVNFNTAFIIYFFLALFAIWAAIKYTVGRKAYGYAGMGDFFVLLFFGWVSVAGVYYLYTHNLPPELFLPATAIGLLSVAVLNLNNMRDLQNDKKAGKNTIPVRIGLTNAMKYHRALITLAFLLYLYFLTIKNYSPLQWVSLIPFILLFLSLRKIATDKPAIYNKALKQTAMMTFLTGLLLLVAVSIK